MSSNEVTLEKLLLILHKHIRLIGGMFVAGILIAGITTYLTPKMYSATTLVNFEFKSANPIDINGRSLDADTYIFTQIDIINSKTVAQKVEDGLTEYEKERLVTAFHAEISIIGRYWRKIKNIGKMMFPSEDASTAEVALDQDEKQTLNMQSSYGWLAQLIGSNLEVVPRFKSRIVEITYSSTDPRIAALMANRFAEAYVATNLQMTIDPARKTAAWFDEQLKSLRQKLEEAQSKLTAYQQKEGIVSSNERLDTESARLQELSSQLVSAQQVTRNAVTEQKKLQEVLGNDSSLMTFGPVFSNPVVKSIKREIREFEGRLVKLSASLGANHPTYRRAKSELQAARQRLRAEVAVIRDGINNNADLTEAREDALSESLARQKQLVLDLKKEHDKIAVLQRDVASAQSTYNGALTQLNITRMQSMVDQTNVAIVDTAIVPRRPSSPELKKYVILGALAGLLLGIGITVLLEILVRRVNSKDDITVELGIPLLGHIKTT